MTKQSLIISAVALATIFLSKTCVAYPKQDLAEGSVDPRLVEYTSDCFDTSTGKVQFGISYEFQNFARLKTKFTGISGVFDGQAPLDIVDKVFNNNIEDKVKAVATKENMSTIRSMLARLAYKAEHIIKRTSGIDIRVRSLKWDHQPKC